jgi:leader peptidase (prepilin peptidase)/N-methyltransferase
MIRILGTIFAGLLGLAFGSFLNVCLSRWPEGESVVQPRSHCRQCGHMLSWWENLPLLSWLVLGGRCQECKSWIGWRYPLVEFSVALLWALQVWRSAYPFFADSSGSAPNVFSNFFSLIAPLGMMIFSWLLVALAALDAEHLWLPDFVTLPGIAVGILYSVAMDAQIQSAIPFFRAIWRTTAARSLSALAAACLILLIRWLYWLMRRREGIGLGDAKLMALLAAWLGLPGALLAFGLGVVLGALAAVAMLAITAARKQSESWAAIRLPLGTFLCLGGIVSSLWGRPILAAYLHWAGL